MSTETASASLRKSASMESAEHINEMLPTESNANLAPQAPDPKPWSQVWSEDSKLRWWARITMLVLTTDVVLLALEWKSGEAWENFFQHFATSPAAAGCAAVLAAIIAARSFGKGLKHTQSEAHLDRIKERDDSWWEKFEWVTDRIIPKDPKAEKLDLDLALTLLLSLRQMTNEKFQTDAAEGVKQHYLAQKPDNYQPWTAAGVSAQLKSLQDFAKAGQHSKATWLSLTSNIYELKGILAFLEKYEPEKVVQAPVFRLSKALPQYRRPITADVLLYVTDIPVLVEFKTWSSFGVHLVESVAKGLRPAMEQEGLRHLVVVTPSSVPPQYAPGGSQSERLAGVLVVQWDPEDGGRTLTEKIEDAVSRSEGIQSSLGVNTGGAQ